MPLSSGPFLGLFRKLQILLFAEIYFDSLGPQLFLRLHLHFVHVLFAQLQLTIGASLVNLHPILDALRVKVMRAEFDFADLLSVQDFVQADRAHLILKL